MPCALFKSHTARSAGIIGTLCPSLAATMARGTPSTPTATLGGGQRCASGTRLRCANLNRCGLVDFLPSTRRQLCLEGIIGILGQDLIEEDAEILGPAGPDSRRRRRVARITKAEQILH